MTPISVVKLWYQNDFGEFGRRDERLLRSLAEDARVRCCVHVEPPVPEARASAEGCAPRRELLERRRQGIREGKLRLFTPTAEGGSLAAAVRSLEAYLEGEGVFDGPSLLWVSAPGALADGVLQTFAGRFRWRICELEDDHRQYAPPRSEARLAIQRQYQRAVRAADLVISNSTALLEDLAAAHPRRLHVPNAVAFDAFAGPQPEPAWMQSLPRPRLGYVGNLGVRLDQECLADVAGAFPSGTLLLAGPGQEQLPADLRSRANVVLPGPVPAEEVPAVLQHCDVLLLPHEISPLTEHMHPQKLEEYLASGRPVVATRVAGARELPGLVTLADHAAGLVAGVRAVLDHDPADRRERRLAHARENTWESAAKRILEAALAVPNPGEHWRQEQSLRYFEHDRPEVRQLVPEAARRILDVGCGTGRLGEALRATRQVHVTGIEQDPAAARRAAECLDRVRVGDVLSLLPGLASERFDCVILADVLEHLPAPEVLLAELRRLLHSGGTLVLSVPNVAHWSVVRQLLRGEFEYQEAGILDRTHLRFFTPRSVRRLLQENGFEAVRVVQSRWAEDGAPAQVTAALQELGLVSEDFHELSRAHQILLVARPAVESAPDPDDAPVSVVIPVCNGVDYTAACLRDLQQYDAHLIREIIVIDNGSTDATEREVRRFAGVKLISNPTNLGFAGAVNQGISAAAAPVVCVLNNDTQLTPGWLARPLEVLQAEPRAGLVGPITNYARGRQQVPLGEVRDPEEMRRRAAGRIREEAGVVEDVDFLSGFCFLGRTALLRQIGGVPGAYGEGTFEDTELSRLMRRQGWRLLIARDAFVYHLGNRTFAALGIDLMKKQQENQRVFLERHSGDAGLVAKLVMESGQAEKALRLCLTALKAEPHDLDALWVAARATAALGRTGACERLTARYRAACPCHFGPPPEQASGSMPLRSEIPSGSRPPSAPAVVS